VRHPESDILGAFVRVLQFVEGGGVGARRWAARLAPASRRARGRQHRFAARRAVAFGQCW